MKIKIPKRTIKRAVDTRTLQIISSDELMALGHESTEYATLRRTATKSQQDNCPAYVCDICGYGVYAPLLAATRQPYWRHFLGAPRTCPWYSGEPDHIDTVSASQFNGAQESPLHFKIKTEIGEILNIDPAASDVLIDKYIQHANERRRPDVSAIYGERKIAIEIQLAHTQIPIIIGREKFYQNEGRFLIWVTWNFQEEPLDKLPRTFLDVYHSHQENLFSLDHNCFELSKKMNRLFFRAFRHSADRWKSENITLANLKWDKPGLPYFYEPEDSWRKNWIEEWKKATTEKDTNFATRRKLLQKVIDQFSIDTNIDQLEQIHFPRLLNCLFSIGFRKVMGTRESTVIATVNSFLNPGTLVRQKFAQIIFTAIKRSNIPELMERESIRRKIRAAVSANPQEPPDSAITQILCKIFPKWFGSGFLNPDISD